MSFSTEDKYRIVMALCHAGTVLDPGSVNFNSIVRDRLAIDNIYVEERAVYLVDEIEAVRLQLRSSPTKSNVKRIGDIELDTTISLDLIKKELNRLITELSQLLDISNQCKGSGGSSSASVCW